MNDILNYIIKNFTIGRLALAIMIIGTLLLPTMNFGARVLASGIYIAIYAFVTEMV